MHLLIDIVSAPVPIARQSPGVSVPSEFSIIRGFLPSMIATAELVVPRSIPMTGPLIFSSLSIFSAYPLRNWDAMGVRSCVEVLKEDAPREAVCLIIRDANILQVYQR